MKRKELFVNCEQLVIIKVSSMINTKKRKTGKAHLSYLHNFIPTFSQYNIAPNIACKTFQQSLVGEIILQIVLRAEKQANLHELAIDHSLKMLQKLQNCYKRYEQMNAICDEEPQLHESQAEPIQICSYYRQEGKIAQQQKQPFNKRGKISSRHMLRHPKQKSQSCDLNDQLKRKQKFIKQSTDLRQSNNKNIITLNFRVRNSEGEDHSTQIQQLLRRKKELLLQQKQPARNHTQNSRNVSSDRKERKYFGQDDEGKAFELVLNKRKNPVALLHAVSLANIRTLPAQQVQQGIKKKPIVELMTKKRPKRGKDLGDTCVLIEQLYDTEICEKIEQEKAIEDIIKPERGVKLSIKDRSCTQQSIKLPNIR